MIFKSREEAARLLADRLKGLKGVKPLILAIPRGAVPMGHIVSEALEGELDVVLVHKLRAPFQPELAVGSVDEAGEVFLGNIFHGLDISEEYLRDEKKTQMENLKRQRRLYTPVRSPIDPKGRVVIVIDDGIATGASMIAALRAVRSKNPQKLIAATAVAPKDTVQVIRKLADEVVCLETPDDFYAVGQYFQEFSQVSDEEVVETLGGSCSGSSKAS